MGYSAFQSNAFQRNAFQIQGTSITPVQTGPLSIGGNKLKNRKKHLPGKDEWGWGKIPYPEKKKRLAIQPEAVVESTPLPLSQVAIVGSLMFANIQHPPIVIKAPSRPSILDSDDDDAFFLLMM